MTTRKERRLVSLHRLVPVGRGDLYREVWGELAADVTGGGAHAWRFVARDDRDLHLEFLEFEAGSDPRLRSRVSELLGRLDLEVGEARVEEWLEAG